LQDARAKVQAMDANSSMKRGFVQGFIESSGRADNQAQQVWDMEQQTVDTAGEMVAFLSSSRGQWTLESGQFVFNDDNSLSRFNGYVTKINALVEREQALQRANFAQTDQHLKELESH
jgi:hypothetical protein